MTWRKSFWNSLSEGDYIDKLPMDPYSDSALVYKKANGNFILYSQSSNFEDDGGTYRNWEDKEGDVVFWPVNE